MADPGRDVLRPVPHHARQHDRQRRAALHPARPRRVAVDARVDDQRLRPLVRGPDHAGRQAGRPLRAQAPVPGRPRDLHGHVGGLRARAERRVARGLPGRAGRGRGADEPADPVDHRGRLPAPRARHRDRDLGRHLGARAGHRPGARRRPRGARRLVGRLLDQPARRDRRGARHALGRRRVARPHEPDPRPARRRPHHRRGSSSWSGASSRPTTTAGPRPTRSASWSRPW